MRTKASPKRSRASSWRHRREPEGPYRPIPLGIRMVFMKICVSCRREHFRAPEGVPKIASKNEPKMVQNWSKNGPKKGTKNGPFLGVQNGRFARDILQKWYKSDGVRAELRLRTDPSPWTPLPEVASSEAETVLSVP